MTKATYHLICCVFFLGLTSTASLAKTEFEALDEFCSVAQSDAGEAIVMFDKWHGVPPSKSKQSLRERSREVHASLMRMERMRIAEITEKAKRETGEDYSSMAMAALQMKSIHFRYALCQRERRLNADPETIKTESYQRCISVFGKLIPETHQLCF